jgi:hypothetical protein
MRLPKRELAYVCACVCEMIGFRRSQSPRNHSKCPITFVSLNYFKVSFRRACYQQTPRSSYYHVVRFKPISVSGFHIGAARFLSRVQQGVVLRLLALNGTVCEDVCNWDKCTVTNNVAAVITRGSGQK